jgi:hypothetical protein
MTALVQQRCLHHVEREAVARCPECGQFYCRECIVEHDDRVICAACLRRTSASAAEKNSRWSAIRDVVQITAGLLLAWLFFYFAGRVLLTIPTSFHDGTLWHTE